MDRVIELEMAAGVTSYDVAALQEQTYKTEREAAFPLLHPPILPSLEDPPQKPPVLTTNTEMTGDDYNKPAGPAPLPKSFPPRQRSHPLRTALPIPFASRKNAMWALRSAPLSDVQPPTSSGFYLIRCVGFGLLPVRSPLLRESSLFLGVR